MASAFFLVSIAFERYFAVVYPLSMKEKMTKKKVRIIATCCWLLSLIWLLPSIIVMDYDVKRDFCDYVFPTKFLEETFQVGCFIVAGAIPICIMSYLYARIIFVLWIERSRAGLGTRQVVISRVRRRVTKVAMTITVIYGLCWLPNLIQLMASLGPTGFKISVLLVTLNSSVNPLLYTLQSEPFRRNLKNLFCNLFCSRKTRVDIELRRRDV